MDARRHWFRVRAQDDRNNDEQRAALHLYEGVGGFGITARNLRADLDALGDLTHLDVHIHSDGGDVFEGFSVFNLLAEHPARVVVHVDGVAASIASVIAMAGDEIRIAANGWLMIHEPRVSARDFRAQDCVTWAANLDRMTEQFVDAYRRHCSLDEDDLRARLAAETWFTADEALACGLAHHVDGAVQAAARLDLRSFHNVPEGVRALGLTPTETPMPTTKGTSDDDVQLPAPTPEAAAPHVDPPAATLGEAGEAPGAAPAASILAGHLAGGAAENPVGLSPAVAAALQGLAPGLTAALQKVDAALERLESQTAAADRRELEARVDQLVRAGQVPPAERDAEVEVLAASDTDARAQRLTLLGRRPAMLAAQFAFETSTGDGDITVDADDFTAPGGSADPEALKLIAQARAEGGSDPAAAKAALYRLVGETP